MHTVEQLGEYRHRKQLQEEEREPLEAQRAQAYEKTNRLLHEWSADADSFFEPKDYEHPGAIEQKKQNKYRTIWFTLIDSLVHQDIQGQGIISPQAEKTLVAQWERIESERKRTLEQGQRQLIDEATKRLKETSLCTALGVCDDENLRIVSAGLYHGGNKDTKVIEKLWTLLSPDEQQQYPVDRVYYTNPKLKIELKTRGGLMDLLEQLYTEIGMTELRHTYLATPAHLVEAADAVLISVARALAPEGEIEQAELEVAA